MFFFLCYRALDTLNNEELENEKDIIDEIEENTEEEAKVSFSIIIFLTGITVVWIMV